MTVGEANVWNPKTVLQLSADTKRIEERITASAGQSLFTLLTFAYALDTGSLEVHKNGLLLTQGVDWVENTITTFSLVLAATAGDQIVATGYVAITADVDVRDTDIFVTNYQAIRDYAGTEITLYSQGRVITGDGGQKFFEKQTGGAPGDFVDNNFDVIVPTGGDGSIGWISNRVLELTNTRLQDFTSALGLEAHAGAITGYIVITNYFDSVRTIESGARFRFTGTTTGGKAGNVPDADGFFYDLDGKQFLNVTPVLFVEQWGAIGDGDGAGAGTDDAAAIQLIFNYIRDTGAEIKFKHNATYLCDTGLTLLSNSINTTSWLIDFSNCIFDFSNLTGAAIGLRIGATSQANAHDLEIVRLVNAPTLLGPESANPNATQTSLSSTNAIADTTTVGLSLEFALNFDIDPMLIRKFYTGWKSNFVFPITTRQLKSVANYIGAIIEGDSTRAHHTEALFTECHYGLVIQPALAKVVTNQIFDGPRFENCGVPITIDANLGAIASVNDVAIQHPYFESNDFDHVRLGVLFDPAAAGRAIRTANSTGYILNFDLIAGLWSRPGAWNSGAGNSPLYCGTNGVVKGGTFSAPANFDDFINITPSMQLHQLTDNSVSLETTTKAVLLPGDASVAFDGTIVGSDIALQDVFGNVATVDRDSVGKYTINFTEPYSLGINGFTASILVKNAYGNSTSVIAGDSFQFETRAHTTGALTDFNKVKVWIRGLAT